MARMLGNTPHGRYSVCKCRLCGRKPSEDPPHRRAQRSREAGGLREQKRSAWAAVRAGLGSLVDLDGGSTRSSARPRRERRGLADDWRAVGDDLRKGMHS